MLSLECWKRVFWHHQPILLSFNSCRLTCSFSPTKTKPAKRRHRICWQPKKHEEMRRFFYRSLCFKFEFRSKLSKSSPKSLMYLVRVEETKVKSCRTNKKLGVQYVRSTYVRMYIDCFIGALYIHLQNCVISLTSFFLFTVQLGMSFSLSNVRTYQHLVKPSSQWFES